MDRLIQQALLQVLTPIFDPTFSDASFGFRPWRMAGGPMNRALGIAYWRAQGLLSLTECYEATREAWRTAGCGPARPVV